MLKFSYKRSQTSVLYLAQTKKHNLFWKINITRRILPYSYNPKYSTTTKNNYKLKHKERLYKNLPSASQTYVRKIPYHFLENGNTYQKTLFLKS